MRIRRNEDEKVIAAQFKDNKFANSFEDDLFEYDADIDFSYSDKQLMNEVARDRVYGTSNIGPIKRDKSVMRDRLYRDAIEEASRVKTGGYYNEFDKDKVRNNVRGNVPGRIRHKVNDENCVKVIEYKEKRSEIEQVDGFNQYAWSEQPVETFNVETFKMSEPMKEIKPSTNNEIFNMPFEFKQDKPNMYDDIMNKVSNDIRKQADKPVVGDRSDTKLVDEGREQIKKEHANKINNIPYKKTLVFEKGKYEDLKDELVVRECRKDKNSNTKDNQSMALGEKIGSIILMIIPILGFLVSVVETMRKSRSAVYKGFARACLAVHMIVSLACTYLYVTGELTVEVIKGYLSRF